MSVELRVLISTDYPAYLARVDELDQVHRVALPDVFRAAPSGEPARTREYYDALLADPNVLLLGAWLDDQLAGYVHAYLRDIEQRWIHVGRRQAIVDNLAVGPAWQRRGLARALMHAASDWARQNGASQLELDVWQANAAAVAFYESLGFTTQRAHLTHPL